MRWRHISILSNTQSSRQRFLSWTSRVPLPTLQPVSFDADPKQRFEYDEYAMDVPSKALLYDAPHLAVFRSDFALPSSWFYSALKSITHLNLDQSIFQKDEDYRTLSSALSSVSLHWLRLGGSDMPVCPPGISINTPKLQTLDLDCYWDTQTQALISTINAPNLHSLICSVSFQGYHTLAGLSIGTTSPLCVSFRYT